MKNEFFFKQHPSVPKTKLAVAWHKHQKEKVTTQKMGALKDGSCDPVMDGITSME